MSTNEKLTPGMVLGRYELLLPIAQGGMATVWAARQRGSRGFQKTVAIKTMLPTLSEDPQFEQMFLDEAALAAKIHHPHVCEILDLGEQDEILYIVMEWIDGEALSVIHKAARKNQAQLPIRLTLRMLAQACGGLHAAHELRDENDIPLQLVHRDVSPQNILVTYDGIIKLVDFGVAKAMGRAGGETTAGQLKGKVPYMSPEQARGGLVDRRTDIFAMGIVLYKLTTGLHPFMGENDLVTMRNIISRPLLPPRVKNPSFPAEVEQVLIKCLQKDADKRYQTMAELGAAIERAAATLGVGDEDLGTYVRTLMGERGAKRRAAVRDAVRTADERFATGTHQAVVVPQTVHEGVSEIVLTKMNSGVKEDLLVDRTSVTSGGPTSTPGQSWAPPTSEAGRTDQPVVSATGDELPGLRRTRVPLFVGAAAAVAVVLGGVVLLRSNAPSGHTQGVGTSPPVVATQAAVTAAPTVTASAAPTVAPTASASAAPTSTALSVNSLPDADDKDKKKAVPAGPLPGVAPSGKAADSDKPIKRVSTDKVPIFTNPGF
ncbi:Serine/threonine-protein kinase [Minicystis rosea]|nr:Serine/threonine-protein kinase [Minicystis rosea]